MIGRLRGPKVLPQKYRGGEAISTLAIWSAAPSLRRVPSANARSEGAVGDTGEHAGGVVAPDATEVPNTMVTTIDRAATIERHRMK